MSTIIDYSIYLEAIVKTLSSETSLMKTQKKEMIAQFDKFALTTQQIADILTKTLVAETQYLNQYATQGAIALLKLDMEREKLNLELLKIQAEIDLINAQKAKLTKDMEKTDKEMEHLDAQILLVGAQQALVDRQLNGYDDNLIVKAGEYQGGLASFAVNANSDDAQDAINEFLNTINQMKGRVTT